MTTETQIAASELLVEMLLKGNEVVAYSFGLSMSPLIPPRSKIRLKPVAFDELSIGDIVFFRPPDMKGGGTLHRIIGINRGERTLTTKGDRLPLPDTPIPGERVFGLLVEIQTDRFSYRLDNPFAKLFNRLAALASSRSAPLFSAAKLVKQLINRR
ncbi:MAG: hypothetical protein Kow0090_00170 [Myxococcota bacterium]